MEPGRATGLLVGLMKPTVHGFLKKLAFFGGVCRVCRVRKEPMDSPWAARGLPVGWPWDGRGMALGCPCNEQEINSIFKSTNVDLREGAPENWVLDLFPGRAAHRRW